MYLKPSSLLVEHISLLPKGGRALDVAMGTGRNALYLAEHGFEVEGVDIDEAAVLACKERASRRGIIIQPHIADLTSYQILEKNYDLILCFRYLQRDLIPKMKAGLKSGGFIVYETFLIDQHLRFGTPKKKEYCFKHNELLHFFFDFRILYYKEGFVTENKALAGLVAQKKPKKNTTHARNLHPASPYGTKQ